MVVEFVPAAKTPEGAPPEIVGAVVSGIGLLTVTDIDAEVVWFPAASLATAAKVWEPFIAEVVFQETE